MSRESSPGAALFRRCPSCSDGKIYRDDSHPSCIYCLALDPNHEVEDCTICQGLSAATRRDRRLRVRARGSSTPEGRSSVPPATSRSASAEPPAKKRHERPQKSLSGSGVGASTVTTVPPSVTRPSSTPRSSPSTSTRWDKPPSLVVPSSHGRPPSTAASTAIPSTGHTSRRSSTDSRPRTVTTMSVDAPSTTKPTGPSTAPSTGQPRSSSTSTPSSTGTSSTRHPRVGYKSPTGTAAPQQPSEDVFASMKEVLDSQRRAMRKLEQRLVAQDEERARERERETARFQEWADAERKRHSDAWEQHVREAQQAEAARMEAYRFEFEALTTRLPTGHTLPADPIADFQEEARRALLDEQERLRAGGDPLLGQVPRESDEGETEDEGDEWGLHPPPDHHEDPAGPVDFHQGPLGPLDPAPQRPLAPESPELIPLEEAPARPSPPEDAPSFVSLVQRAALHFNLPLEKTQPSSSYLLSKLAEPSRTLSALPMEPLLWDAGIELMKTPASSPAINSRIDKKYRVPPSAPQCLRGQPSAASIIAASAKTPGASQVQDHLLSPPFQRC